MFRKDVKNHKHVFWDLVRSVFCDSLIQVFNICYRSIGKMKGRVNNQLPNNLPQLQNCIKRDAAGYKEEVSVRIRRNCWLTFVFISFNNNMNTLNPCSTSSNTIHKQMTKTFKIWSSSWRTSATATPKSWNRFRTIWSSCSSYLPPT